MFSKDFKIDFIGIGAPRSGTTWLSSVLSEHPEICFSKTKELDFFNAEHFYWAKNWTQKYKKLGFKWYESQFSHFKKKQKRGEYSVFYIFDKEAPRMIKEFFPDVKLILSFRNPTEAVYSHYLYHRLDLDLPDFEKMLTKKHPFLKYGFYSGYLENYYKYFDRNSIMIILYDEIKNNPELLIRKLYRFLDVNDEFTPNCINEVINPVGVKQAIEAKMYFNIRNKIRKKIREGLGRFPFVKKNLVKIDNIMKKILFKTGKRKKVTLEIPLNIRMKLDKIYREEINKLEKLINRDLLIWKK